jgi:hypothetical protein
MLLSSGLGHLPFRLSAGFPRLAAGLTLVQNPESLAQNFGAAETHAGHKLFVRLAEFFARVEDKLGTQGLVGRKLRRPSRVLHATPSCHAEILSTTALP